MALINSVNDISELCMMIFRGSEKSCTLFVMPLALARVVYATVSGDDGAIVKDTLKGVLLYFILVYSFEHVLNVLFELPQAFLPGFTYEAASKLNPENLASASAGASKTALPWVLEDGANLVLSGLFWIAVFFHLLFMAMMCGMAPIVFLLGSVVGIGFGLRVFFGLLVLSSSWPVLWAAFDQVRGFLSAHGRGGFGEYMIECLVLILKAVGPMVLGYSAANSSAGRVAVSSLGAAWGLGKTVGNLGSSAMKNKFAARAAEKEKQKTKKALGVKMASVQAGDQAGNPIGRAGLGGGFGSDRPEGGSSDERASFSKLGERGGAIARSPFLSHLEGSIVKNTEMNGVFTNSGGAGERVKTSIYSGSESGYPWRSDGVKTSVSDRSEKQPVRAENASSNRDKACKAVPEVKVTSAKNAKSKTNAIRRQGLGAEIMAELIDEAKENEVGPMSREPKI